MSWTRRLPSGKWQGGFRSPDGQRHTSSWPTRTAAKLWAAEQELAARLQVGRRDMTVGEWEPLWWPQWSVEPNTRATAAIRMRLYVRPEWEDVQLADITTFRVQQWAHRLLEEGTGRDTVRSSVRVLSALCVGAVQADLLPSNPCLQVRLPPAVKRTPRYLTEPELDKLVAELPAPVADMAIVAAFTGLRLGELTGLHCHRVNLDRKRLEVVETVQEIGGAMTVKLYPKSSASRRTVPLADRALRALEPHVREGTGLVFSTPQGGPMSGRNMSTRVWRPTRIKVGLPDPQPRWHDLRHTCASWLVQAGVPLIEVQRMLGHSSITVTQTYAHLAPDSYDRVLTALNS